jgi:uncharacterized protein YeaO (DUF488 family)
MVNVKRVYESLSGKGARFLVERLWPRGMKKEALKIDAWLKDVAPSTGLRQWFGHDPAKWSAFQQRYTAELREHPEALEPILYAALKGDVTLLYSAHDTEHNAAIVLKRYVEKLMAKRRGLHA